MCRHLITVPAGVAFEPSTGTLSVIPGPDRPGTFARTRYAQPGISGRSQRGSQGPQPSRHSWRFDLGSFECERRAHNLGQRGISRWTLSGRASSDCSPISSPVVQFAPALILRKRSDRSLIRFLIEAIEQIQASGTVPEGVLDLIETSDEALFSDDPLGELEKFADNRKVYFPLEANDEQLEILQRLEHQHGVLVQGPPGTGKSHTIANLICHLLATGQRVLVTSHTPRALRVLRDKIPDEVRSLCVSLVGTDRTAIEEVEHSVLGITHRYDHYDIGRQRQRIRELEHALDLRRRENAVFTSELRALRERETYRHVLGFGDYEGTAQQIAQRLASEDPRLGWIPDSLSPSVESPLTDREAVNLLRVFRELDSLRMSLGHHLASFLGRNSVSRRIR